MTSSAGALSFLVMTESRKPRANDVASLFDVSLDPLEFAAAGTSEGRAWIASLPTVIARMCERWSLMLETRPACFGYHAAVLPVRRDGAPLVLKVTWPSDKAVDEARALAAWAGRGAARLIESDVDTGALLLERLDSARTLLDLPIFEAAAAASRLLRRLAVPAPDDFPRLSELAACLPDSLVKRQARQGRPLPPEVIDAARAICRELSTAIDDRFLIHADLHYGNILAGAREPWLAIDPKPMRGEPEYAVPELFWPRLDELRSPEAIHQVLRTVVVSGGLDEERARGWVIVRSVDYWLWALEHDLTEDPRRCRRILDALL